MKTSTLLDIAGMTEDLTARFSIVGTLDFTQHSYPNWIQIYKAFSDLHKDHYEILERILIIVDGDWYDNRFACGVLLEGIQRVLNQVDISNFFIELITTNNTVSAELDYLQKSVSTDPVPIHANICQGSFSRQEQGQRLRFDISQIEKTLQPLQKSCHLDFLSNHPSICMAPWTHLYVRTNQQVLPCCESNTSLGDLRVSDLEQIWNSTTLKEIRMHMLKRQRHPACANCYINEDAGKTSYRQYINRKMSHHVMKIDCTDQQGQFDRFEINYLHFKFSNLCNLACRTCGPNSSSSWHAVASSIGDLPKNAPVLISANDDNSLFKKFVQHLDSVDLIKFTGGEPLIMQEFYDILDLLISEKRTDVELFYNTNMMQLQYRGRHILDLWKNFTKIKVGISIDAEGSRGEYIRSFSKWNVILENVRQMKAQCPHIYFFISPTVSILNVLHLPDLHRSLIMQGLIEPSQFDINTLTEPKALSVLCCPSELQEMVNLYYKKHIAWLQTVDKTGRSIGAFAGVLNLLGIGEKFDPVSFWTYVDKLDSYHQTDLMATFPELALLPRLPTTV